MLNLYTHFSISLNKRETHSFIHLLISKYLLSSYELSGTILRSGDTEENRIKSEPFFDHVLAKIPLWAEFKTKVCMQIVWEVILESRRKM